MTTTETNRFEKAAAKLEREMGFAVHVEWAPANREYVVDGRACANIREARKVARRQKDRWHTTIRGRVGW